MKCPKAEYSLEFAYDSGGRGILKLLNDSLTICEARARTGSINQNGNLVKAIKYGTWTIQEKSVDTTEAGMGWEPNRGGNGATI